VVVTVVVVVVVVMIVVAVVVVVVVGLLSEFDFRRNHFFSYDAKTWVVFLICTGHSTVCIGRLQIFILMHSLIQK
jgi:hypothetical protein